VKQNAQTAAADIKTKSAEAKDRLADAWITTQVAIPAPRIKTPNGVSHKA